MTTRALPGLRLAGLFNMGMLYAGKTSGMLVAFIFLPLYNRLLGAEQFGVVAVILSMQALLVMLDLGMSTLVSRDCALADAEPATLLTLVRCAERALTGFYLLLLAGAALAKLGGALPSLEPLAALGAVILFWLLVLQNLYYSGMLARRAYSTASILQVVGVALRAAATAYVLMQVDATLTAFVLTQLAFSALHLAVTRICFRRVLSGNNNPAIAIGQPSPGDIWALLKRGRSLALFALAGAAVLQLDKPIVSAFMSPASVAPYFLAMTVCMVPMSVLAGPVAQYFQPMLLNAVARAEPAPARRAITLFSVMLLGATLLPSLAFWLLRAPLIELWTGGHAGNAVIADYVGILLPGLTIGALGFIPYSLLISVNDFKFQASLSMALTLVTLGAAAVCAARQNIDAICYIYALYHGASTLLSWLRAMFLSSTRELAKISFSITIACLLALALAAVSLRHAFQ